MSVVHAIAWGLIDNEELAKNFRHWRREARKELRTHRLRLRATGNGYYKLDRKTEKGGHQRYAVHAYGNFALCIHMASKLITPSNPEK